MKHSYVLMSACQYDHLTSIHPSLIFLLCDIHNKRKTMTFNAWHNCHLFQVISQLSLWKLTAHPYLFWNND